ncbi:hypothetical protein Tco_1359981 [Tanacetum coccineum]
MSNWRRKKEMSKELQGCHKLNKRLILEKTTIFVGQGKELTCLQDALENAGLSICPQTIERLKPATSHVTAEKALRLVYQTHDLTLGHVWWIHKETQTQLLYLVKSGSYYNDAASGHVLSTIVFYDSFRVIPLKIGEGFIGKTLRTLKPQFFLMAPNHDILNEALLTTLERHFASFKFLSPSQIVDNQGCVKDIDNSPGNGNGNALSEPPRSLKRKFEDIPKSLDDDVVIVARYLKKVTLFLLPSTSTFAYAKDNISKDFHLDSLHFTLEDECDDGTCFRIDDNESLESCIAWGRTNRSHIKLRVHPRH